MEINFLITSLIVIFLPGTGVLYTLAIGLGQGWRASVAASFGCTLGILPAAFASIIGLAAIFHASALAFQVVKILGVAYLLYMAWATLHASSMLDVAGDRRRASYFRIALNGAFLNILNPKLSLFFLAFLPQFVDVNRGGAALHMGALATVFMVLTFIVFVGYGAAASIARDYVISRPVVMNWLKRSFAMAFGFLGLRLALAER